MKGKPLNKQTESKFIRDFIVDELEDMFHKLFFIKPDKEPFDSLRLEMLRLLKEVEDFLW